MANEIFYAVGCETFFLFPFVGRQLASGKQTDFDEKSQKHANSEGDKKKDPKEESTKEEGKSDNPISARQEIAEDKPHYHISGMSDDWSSSLLHFFLLFFLLFLNVVKEKRFPPNSPP